MLPSFIVEDGVRREDSASAALDLSGAQGETLLVTLGITRIIEQESLDLTIWGSADGAEWGAKPLAAFPQKFYCGTYSILIDLAEAPNVKFLRAQWKMGRWGRGEPKPLFGFYLFAEKSAVGALAARATQ
ncbi:MAG: hypothetical protein JJE04_21290 [Acidobacteriia bacterium]|nr:hypothetical protein [Terriglobia bacterium]